MRGLEHAWDKKDDAKDDLETGKERAESRAQEARGESSSQQGADGGSTPRAGGGPVRFPRRPRADSTKTGEERISRRR